MKRLPLLLMLLALVMFMLAGDVFSYMIDDNTKVLQKRSNNGGYGTTWTDVIGASSQFNIYGIDVSFSSGNITFDLYTNFNHDGIYQLTPYAIYTYLADLALDVDQNGTYEYGVVLLDHDKWTDGNLKYPTSLVDLDVGLYSVIDWYTSIDFMNGYTNPMVYYGGRWDQSVPVIKIPNVAVKNGIPKSTATVTSTDIPGDNPNYKWTATFNYSLIPGFADGLANGFDVFWGGMTCSNDAISGSLAGPSIPEPATLVLMSFGLIGLVVIGRCKMKNSCRRKL
ncbi:PEP-CTERM sorting domain-containing protein [Candidatus Poribacteria bacterium]|nr:PEP-CTERM sorting domain-containing protein [Candidatus Poribacteria bacterium]